MSTKSALWLILSAMLLVFAIYAEHHEDRVKELSNKSVEQIEMLLDE